MISEWWAGSRQQYRMDKAKFWEKQYRRGHASVVGTPPAALAKTEETTNPDPVIITQKVPVRQTVVIRDTTIVSDTVYQVIGEQ